MIEGDGPVHIWFGLTYARYAVLDRTVLQSMPHEWQERFVSLMDEVAEATPFLPDLEYAVQVRGSSGRFTKSPIPHYRRGPRSIEELAKCLEQS